MLANAALPPAVPAARALPAFPSREQQSLVAARRASECGSFRDLAALASAKHSSKPSLSSQACQTCQEHWCGQTEDTCSQYRRFGAFLETEMFAEISETFLGRVFSELSFCSKFVERECLKYGFRKWGQQAKQTSFIDDRQGLGNPSRFPSVQSSAVQERDMLLTSVFGNICFGCLFRLP